MPERSLRPRYPAVSNVIRAAMGPPKFRGRGDCRSYQLSWAILS